MFFYDVVQDPFRLCVDKINADSNIRLLISSTICVDCDCGLFQVRRLLLVHWVNQRSNRKIRRGGKSMESVAGIFTSRANADRAISAIKALSIPDERIVLLMPHSAPAETEGQVATTDAEPTGIGEALGGTVGGAIGVASGASLGAAAASLFVPGVGPVLAAGILAAAVLGIGGAAAGMAVGEALEEGIDDGLPHDELYLYEDALRRGRTVIVAFVPDDDAADRVREVLAKAGAESIDAAREDWWLGLRDAEAEHYAAQGRDFQGDEISYRRGFEAALNAKWRGRSYAELATSADQFFADSGTDQAFRLGYERGLAHLKRLESKTGKATTATG
jgi:hypothetical protein